MNRLHKIAILSLWAGLLIAGCGNEEETPATNVGSGSVDLQLVAGTQTMCPIMDNNPVNKDLFYDYQGKRIYFCCAGCQETFKKDPEKYIKQMEDTGVAFARVIEK
ncbi:MAG: hypothetical protein AMJ79_13295 [Phycisphaerae bacterium SM23_30]|nr:MAG: hypothetical protein AMJ79_13295 [Phycisphaerae bacterium SM23_30]